MLELKAVSLSTRFFTNVGMLVNVKSLLVVATKKKGVLLITFEEFIGCLNSSIDLTRRIGPFVKQLFSVAHSNFLELAGDPTKANRIANGTDGIDDTIVSSFPYEDDIEAVTLFFMEEMTPGVLTRLKYDFDIVESMDSYMPMAYALANKFFHIIKSANNDTSTAEDMNKWYADCIKQPLIYVNKFKDEIKAAVYADSGSRCPITGQLLKPNKRAIILIYQKDIPNELKIRLHNELGLDEPSNEYSIDNCLAVHSSFADDYMLFGKYDFEEVKKAFLAKKNISQRKILSSSIETQKIDELIRDLINRLSMSELASVNPNDARLNYDPVEVYEKIPADKFLADEVIGNSSSFYKKIKNWFLAAEAFAGKPRVEKIMEAVKETYNKLKTKSDDKREIVNEMANWIIVSLGLFDKKTTYKRPAQVLVHFFIQDCEVFEKNEITE